MKNIIILVFIFGNILYSQDYDPIQIPFRFKGMNNYFLSADSIAFKQTNLLKGWHWDSQKKINEVLLMNQVDTYHDRYKDTFQTNVNYIVKPEGYSHAVSNELLNARSFQYSPVLLINKLKPDSLIFRLGDTLKEIFGFMIIKGKINDNPNLPYFNSLVIDSNLAVSLKNQVILENSWPSNMLSISSDDTTSSTLDSFLCQTLYFSINLKKIDNLPISDSNVLKIELPYTLGFDNTPRFIQFDSIPSLTPNDTIVSNRGIFRKLVFKDSLNPRIFFIKRNMLLNNNSNITISGYFRMDGNYQDNNENIKNGNPTNGEIDSLKIKVTYLGNAEIAINWLRFETPHAQRYFRGYYDNTLKNRVQYVLDSFNFYHPNDRIFRFNTIIEGFPMNWQAERYFNKLIGNIGTNEVLPLFPEHYERYVNPPERWFGLYSAPNWLSVPYSFKGYDDPNYEDKKKIPNLIKTFGITNGYFGRRLDDSGVVFDPKQTSYETYLYSNGTYHPINRFRNSFNLNEYLDQINFVNGGGRGSWLNAIEGFIYNKFINNTINSYLYNDKSWWGQLFTHTSWEKDIRDTIFYRQTQRPLTGEEFRYLSGIPVILGTKGILYDGAYSCGGDSVWDGNQNQNVWRDPKPQMNDYDILDKNSSIHLTLSSLNDWDFLKHDSTGSDFFNTIKEHYSLSKIAYNLDSVAKYLDRPRDRIYMGRKSVRIEMRKLHDWITINDTTLMNLKLQSYYAHGYKIWYNQHPKYSSYYKLGNFIDTSKIKTRKLWDHYDNRPQIDFENNDSSFYDITLLNTTFDTTMTKEWYIGYANRRTNPLIFTNSFNSPLGGEYHLDFYSTAEYDDYVLKDSSKNLYGFMLPKTYWRDQFWKRLGCRQIQIPFNLQNLVPPPGQVFTDDPNYLIIKELGVGTPYFSDSINYYWTQAKYYHKIDTVIRPNGILVSNLLPGQGKIIHTYWRDVCNDISHQDLNCIEIDSVLDFSVIKDNNRWDSCFYIVRVHNKSGWQLDTIDFKIRIKSDKSLSFLTFSSNYDLTYDYSDSSVMVRFDSISGFQNYELGTFRIDCDEHFEVKFQFGRKIMEIYPNCVDDTTFEGDCTCGYQMRSSTSCCDNIELYAAETTEDGQLSGKFNVFAKQNTTDCAICEISLVRKDDTKVLAKLTKDMKEKKLNLANFANIGKISMDKSNGRSKDTLVAYIKDKDGKLICKKEIVLETLD